jgi:UDP-2-acetamido-2,6-beta-L-arabino-hexul-4-ose reductase
MLVLVTGSNGFIGKNLTIRLGELARIDVLHFNRNDPISLLYDLVAKSDVIVHLAGENRPIDIAAFEITNINLTKELCTAIEMSGKKIPLIFTSSAQSVLDNQYGKSKLAAEKIVSNFSTKLNNPVLIYRLPSVFGKWARPNYNSVVATFCHNIVNDIPIKINDPSHILRLVYIDSVVSEFIKQIINFPDGINIDEVEPVYEISLLDLAYEIQSFKNSRVNLTTPEVGEGFRRCLYSTYVSYFEPSMFSYPLSFNEDQRGQFVEFLRTPNCGQVSFFTAKPGIKRGGHYHHTKTEKFLVVSGQARFCFRNILTNDKFEIFTSSDSPQVVETVPGWTHDISNVGPDKLIVMLWANEIFNVSHPDTISSLV